MTQVAADGIVVQQIDSVPEQPVRTLTVAHDQGWARLVINEQITKGAELAVGVLRMEPNQYHPLHSHPNVGELYLILDGKVPHAVLLELFTDHGAGTLIRRG